METKTLEALLDSIEHWTRLSEGTQEKNETIYGSSCPLCKLYYSEDAMSCSFTCPVKEKTGKNECEGSPWKDVNKILDDFKLNSPEFKLAAKKQLEFLQSLLPTTIP